jgi:hypothetical protein
MVVWNYIMSPILLYYANDLGTPLIGNDLLGMRILTNVGFWGGIAGIVYGIWWSLKTLIPIKTESANF